MSRKYLILEYKKKQKKIHLLDNPPKNQFSDNVNCRISPIFPIQPKHYIIPDFNKEVYIGLFIFEKAFEVLGNLLSRVDLKYKKKFGLVTV